MYNEFGGYLFICVSASGLITSVVEGKAYFSAIGFSLLCGFCSERFLFSLGAWDRLRYFIVILFVSSI